MEGAKEARPRPPPPAASISSVLGEGDLLRASLVCKWWLRHASDPAASATATRLVCSVSTLMTSPTCSLGSSLFHRPQTTPPPSAWQLLPSPLPTRLTALSPSVAAGMAASSSGSFRASSETYALFSPLHQSGGMALVPSPPKPISNRIFLHKDGGDDGAVSVDLFVLGRDLSIRMRTLKSGIWGVCTKVSIELPEPEPTTGGMLPPVNSKIYMATDAGFILVLDLVAASFSILQLPDRVKTENFRLSCGEDSGLVSHPRRRVSA